MRTTLLAGAASLLTAATAFGQTPAPAAPPPPPQAPAPFTAFAPEPVVDPGLTRSVAEATSGHPWGMIGPKLWGQAEYLLWWVRPMNTPPLIQTVPSAQAVPGTSTSAGQQFFPNPGGGIDLGTFSGARGTVGVNFDRFGLEVSGFGLGTNTATGSLFSNGTPFAVAVPYNSAGAGPANLFASLPGQYSGGVTVTAQTELWGLEANARLPFYAYLTEYTDFLAGFRYLDLRETLNARFQAAFPGGGNVTVQDDIRTRNQFYGGQIGLNGRIGGLDKGLGLDLTPKLALGGVKQRVDLTGSNTITGLGVTPEFEQGGLFARGANQGSFTRDRFACLLSMDANITYNFNRWSQVYVGYSVVFISDVVRPGDQIDSTVNDANLRYLAAASRAPSTANRPAFNWHSTDFTAQGVTFGVRLQY